ncbi:MFS transporter [Nonomuraea africana]|uniref:EmrB/QacA subfamily drug resistance transporter n=1 Tax=Nonomuraea africana TaxID=46171 RepID=A0ABR9KCC4_9ACTN|nr:MFS transporter [Nonomuraea africana]MBE1559585.1 EmrB/QacA subfamily drug resistance transporter [Nonomuraea africana]
MSLHEEANLTAPPPARRKLGLALLVIAAAQLMIVLDGTIVTVALPSIQNALRMAESDLNWVLTSYALAFGGLLLVGGRAGDLFGRRRLFRLGLVVFLLASLLGGLAGNGTVLIAARVLQGLGAAVVAPTALSLLATTFPAGPARDKALGVYGAMGGLGAVVGLLLGGALTEYLSWRWIMFVNIPFAIAVLLSTSVLVEGERERGGLDLPGAITATLGLGSLVFAINRAGQTGWSDGLALTFDAVAAVLLIIFVLIQRRGTTPMLPPTVLADRGRLGANLVMFLMGGGMLATFYFLTLYMQVIKGYAPMLTGLAYLPFAIGIGIGAGAVGPPMLARTSDRTVTMTGLLLAAVGMAWFSLLTPDQNALTVLLPAQLAAGIGLGLVTVAVTIAGVRGVADQDTGIASGLINTTQQIGGALGLAVLAAIATAAAQTQPTGTPAPDALTQGYTTGILAGGALYLAAVLVAALTLKRRTDQAA